MRAQICLSSSALLGNYKILARKAQGQMLLPMLKANAYGHDAIWAAKTLITQKNLYGFGVATFDEALALRKALPKTSRKIPLIVFSDTAPFSTSWIKLCFTHNLEPVMGDVQGMLELQKYLLANSAAAKKIKFHIEVNTGMNRLGIPVDSLSLLKLKPRSVFTHLAESEAPNSVLTQKQIQNFQRVIRWKKLNSPETLIHFANSGAIWNAKAYSFFKEMDLVRPGLSLYGIRPFEKAKTDGLKLVMKFQAPVIQKILLERGDRVGYGGSYLASKSEWVATLGAGYADGVFRAFALKKPLVGRVSMDLIAVKATAKTKIGEMITLWGDRLDPYEVANRANTIPYEIVTRVGERVKKIYE